MKRVDGPTPHGGAYSTVVALRAGVEVDDPAEADFMEIREHAEDGTVIARTYAGDVVDSTPVHSASHAAGEATFPENQDALKLTWDVRRSVDQQPVQTLTELTAALGFEGLTSDGLARALANITALPVWDVAPQPLKDEVEAFLQP